MKNIVRGLAMVMVMAAVLTVAGMAGEPTTPNGSRIPAGPGAFGYAANSRAGELFPTMMGASISAQREFRKALPSIYSYSQTAHYQNRADAALESTDALASFNGEALAAVGCPTTMCSPGSKWVMWDVPFMINETKKMKDGYLGYEHDVSGFATGISRMIGESTAVGLAVGYDYRKLNGRDDYHMKNRADTLHLALFGGTNIGHFFFDAYAGYSRSWNRTERNIYANVDDVYDLDGVVGGNFNDTVWSAGLKASYVWILCNDVRITPSIGFDFSHVRMSGLIEKKPQVVGLRVNKSDYSSLAIPMMVSVNKTFSSNWLAFGGHNSLWTPEVRGGYIPQIGAKRAVTRNAYMDTPAETWRTMSTSMNDSYGTVGAGLKIKLRDKYIFAVDYDYSFASKYQQHRLTAMYGVSF